MFAENGAKKASAKKRAEIWRLASAAEADWLEEQKAYPEQTDCDRLDEAFKLMKVHGIYAPIGIHPGFVPGRTTEEARLGWSGFCTYDYNEVLHCMANQQMFLRTGCFRDGAREEDHVQTAREIMAILAREGLEAKPHRESKFALTIDGFHWQKRAPAERLAVTVN
jgi:hypothetical protein